MTFLFCGKVPVIGIFRHSHRSEMLLLKEEALAPFLTLISLLQPDEGSTKDGESMHLLEHSPADPVTRNIGQVSGDLGVWAGKMYIEGGRGCRGFLGH